MKNKYSLLFFIFFIVLFACKKKTEINISQEKGYITIPNNMEEVSKFENFPNELFGLTTFDWKRQYLFEGEGKYCVIYEIDTACVDNITEYHDYVSELNRLYDIVYPINKKKSNGKLKLDSMEIVYQIIELPFINKPYSCIYATTCINGGLLYILYCQTGGYRNRFKNLSLRLLKSIRIN